jgi:hypothetical protein
LGYHEVSRTSAACSQKVGSRGNPPNIDWLANNNLTGPLKKTKESKRSKLTPVPTPTGEFYLLDVSVTAALGELITGSFSCVAVFRAVVPTNLDIVLIDPSNLTVVDFLTYKEVH